MHYPCVLVINHMTCSAVAAMFSHTEIKTEIILTPSHHDDVLEHTPNSVQLKNS